MGVAISLGGEFSLPGGFRGEELVARWIMSDRRMSGQRLRHGDREVEHMWAQVELGGGLKRCDFLIFLEGVLLLVEVKGVGRSEALDLGSTDYRKNPWKQVSDYRELLMGKLDGLSYDVIPVLVFPFLDDCASAISDYPNVHVLFRGDMNRTFGTVVDEVLMRYHRSIEGYVFDAQAFCALARVIPVVAVEEVSCGEHTPLYLLEQEQSNFAFRPTYGGDRIIYGVAGSGKTVVLLKKAQQLASFGLGEQVLVLCYNRPLAAYLRNRLDPKVTVLTLHKWAFTILATWDDPVLSDEVDSDPYALVVPVVVREIKAGRRVRKYSYILIDEGQDFQKEWFELARLVYDPGDDGDGESFVDPCFFVFLDSLQSIHSRRSGGFTWSSVGIQARGRTKKLRKNYRNAMTIAEYARQFAESARSTLSDGGIDEFVDGESIRPGGQVKKVRVPRYDISSYLVRSIRDLPRGARTMVLYDSVPEVTPSIHETIKLLRKYGIRGVDCVSIPGNFISPAPGVVPFYSVRRSKGLESDVVFLLRSDKLSSRIMYVATTRAREILYDIELGVG